MSRKQKQGAVSEKLDLILSAVNEVNQKVDQQNKELAQLKKEVAVLKQLVDEMAKKNRTQALIAGGVSGGLVAIGFELIRASLAG